MNSTNCAKCELIDNCSFYWNYRNHQDVEERKLVNRFCYSGEQPESCARIQFLKKNNDSPPPCITPEGDCIKTSDIEKIGNCLVTA